MQLERVKSLNQNTFLQGKSVVYVMSRDQRVHDNHALLYAQNEAIKAKLPLIVVFNLLPKSGVRAKEHFEFMLSGLTELHNTLATLNISFHLSFCSDGKALSIEINKFNPSIVIFDYSPLVNIRKLKNEVAKNTKCLVQVVDTHNIIPVWVASVTEEFAAHTFRSKVHKFLLDWLVDPQIIESHPYTHQFEISQDWQRAKKLIENMKASGISINFKSGEKAGLIVLDDFVSNRLNNYAADRNNPTMNGQSDLSPYLHFGQISSLRIALELTKKHTPLLVKEAKLAKYDGTPSLGDSIDAFLEELIVRKELADNYCTYNQNYNNFDGLKDWAKKSLQEHAQDKRDYIYNLSELEQFKTHDNAWNAAQAQLRQTGKMHGYMRMYWAKKILEWSPNPQTAIFNANYLNDHYSLDGGDPNGYVGVQWSIGGLHDRPWFERPVFGKIRYMNYNGLKQKFDVEAYEKQWLK